MEKRLFKQRIINALLFCFFINIVDMFACYVNLFDMHKRGFISRVEFNENIITGDYHTSLQYAVVQFFVLLFFLHYILGRDEIDYIVRLKKRQEYFYARLKTAIKSITAFVILHEIMSLIFIIWYGDIDIMICHKWIQGVAFQIAITILYYTLFYLIYEIVVTIFSKSFSLIFVILLGAAQYYCSKNFFQNIWFPCNDLTLMGDLCTGLREEKDCFFAVTRLIICLFVAIIICFKVKNKEDYLANEKG